MGEVGELVAGLDDLRGPGEGCGGVAVGVGDRHRRLAREVAVERHQFGRATAFGGASPIRP